jgi:serine phosphatase RsbU (regulator of sigma subunit)
MNGVLDVLGLAERQAREGGKALPEQVLEGLLLQMGASCGALGRGAEVLARRGPHEGGTRRVALPAGRDVFWLEASGGSEPDSSLRLAAGMVLETWMVREDLKQARFAERRRLWEMESLRAIAESLGGTLDPMRIAEELLLHATALLDARRGEVWLAPEGGAGGRAPLFLAARVGGEVFKVDEVCALPRTGLLEEGRLAVPIVGRRGLLGVIAVAEREVRGGTAPFSATDGETVGLFASQAAVALENAVLHREDLERQRLERELEVAAEIQRQLLPSSFPVPDGFEVHAHSEPSRQVGGDVYDLVSTGEDVLLMIADITGKGVPAALMAASLHAAVHVLAVGCPLPDELARRLHEHLLLSTPENKFATVFLGCLRPAGRLDYVSAGHNPAIMVTAQGEVTYLESTGPPLGLLPESRFDMAQTELPPGALLLNYTDGFSEAPAAEGDEEFGVERLAAYFVSHRDATLDGLTRGIFEEVRRFTGDVPPHDDRTLLVVRRKGM